jgi:hypothetical protein
MRKIVLATAALAAAALTPTAPAVAAQGAPLYCIAPASAQQAAQSGTSAAAAALTPYKLGKLASLHSLAVVVGASGPGRIEVTLKAHRVVVGHGSLSSKGAGCGQLSIRLTGPGRKLLAHSKKPIKLSIVGVFAPKRGARGQAKGSVTLSK